MKLQSQDMEILLDQSTALGDVLGRLHLVPSQHPHLDVYIAEGVLARIMSRIVSGTSSCSRSSTAVAPIR
jgi:hypothetical protein